MSKKEKILYTIEGGTPQEQRRVQQAMDWLVSPDAWGIGKNLLNNAYKLHKKPVTIEISDKMPVGYLDLNDENKIIVNFEQLEHTKGKNYQNKDYKPTLEGIIAHELTHAGQTRMQEGAIENLQVQSSIQSKVFGDKEMLQQTQAINDITSAPTYQSAMRKLEAYVDELVIPKNNAVKEALSKDKKYKSYVNEFEIPAMHVERLISSRQKSGIRNEDYINSAEMSPEIERKITINFLADLLEIDKKPYENKNWQTTIKGEGNPKGRSV
ncbi:MAG: hypothetical protein R3D71_06390 [Rickettsiales bacterium]